MTITLTVGQFAFFATLPMITFALGMFMTPWGTSAPERKENGETKARVRSMSKTDHQRIGLRVVDQSEAVEPEQVAV